MSTSELLSLALECHRSGNLPRAAEIYRQLLASDPQNSVAANNLGVALIQQGLSVEAVGLFEKAVRLRPDYSEAQENLKNARLQNQLRAAAPSAASGSSVGAVDRPPSSPSNVVGQGGKLLDEGLIRDQLIHDDPWCKTHGANAVDLGGGLLYYSLAYMLHAKLCVCIGSGGGFVPRMMRQAQRDLRINGETWLIDANRPEGGWGRPRWLPATSTFRTQYPEIKLHLLRSDDAARTLFQNRQINYLHIDGDHSYEGCRDDFHAYRPLMAPGSLITIHDTAYHLVAPRTGVHRVLDDLRQLPGIELVDLPFLGAGVAIVRIR